MNKVFFILIFMQLSLKIIGQDNYLTPCSNLSNEINEIKLYDEGFERIISRNFDADYLILFLAKPSFSPEYAFQIRKIDITNYEIKTIIFQENLWNAKNRDSIQVNLYKRRINPDLALKLDSLFKIATDSVNKRSAIGIGLDGESYYLKKQLKKEITCGVIWSPNSNSPLGKIVMVCKDLIEYTKGNSINLTKLKEEISCIYSKIESLQYPAIPEVY